VEDRALFELQDQPQRDHQVKTFQRFISRDDVRFGSKADIGQASGDVRSTPKKKRTLELSRAMSALCQKRTSGRYSITSSARRRNDFGTRQAD
jgi:hypothetical protein